MTARFHDEVMDLKRDVVRMGGLSRGMLERSLKALTEKDSSVSREILDSKDEVRRMDAEIEERALHLLVLNQPVAQDLRRIACILKMVTYLTRIGRYGKDIAQVQIELEEKHNTHCLELLPKMGELVLEMIDKSLKAFEEEELSHIQDLQEADDVVDRMRHDVFRESVVQMGQELERIEEYASYPMVARYLERCGDHACKMAEKVSYMVTGEHVEIS